MRQRTRCGVRRLAIVVGLATVAVSLALASSAGASHLEPGMSISVGGPVRLINQVYLAVPVSVTCPVISLDPDQFVESEEINVGVQEKVSGGTITMGFGRLDFQDTRPFGGGTSGTPLICDGTAHTYSLPVFPNADSSSATAVAFKGGKAVAFAGVGIFVQNTSTFQGESNNVNVGPLPISIKG